VSGTATSPAASSRACGIASPIFSTSVRHGLARPHEGSAGEKAMQWPVMVAALAVAGCSTTYQDGVTAEQMAADTFRIVAKGNAYTPDTALQDYTVLKAAKTTKNMGGTHFVIVSAAGATPEQMQTSAVGNVTFTADDPGTVRSLIKPGQDTYIRVLKVPPGHAPPPGGLSADEIIFFVGGRVKRG
jgi:hypothetical protein